MQEKKHWGENQLKPLKKHEWPTVHEGVGEDHDRVVEVSVLLSDHTERRSLLLLGRLSRRDAGRQVDDHHVCGWSETENKLNTHID